MIAVGAPDRPPVSDGGAVEGSERPDGLVGAATPRPGGAAARQRLCGYGNAKTKMLLPLLGRSSGVSRMLSRELSDDPVLATTYCLPSTA